MAPSTPTDSADDSSHGAVKPVSIHGTPVYGVDVQPETRCAHYHGPTDVVAIRFPCCDRFYPCHACHATVADHEPARWSTTEADTPAVLCGACGTVLSIRQYRSSPDACVECGSTFNPKCVRHHSLYFESRTDEVNVARVDNHPEKA